MKKLALTFILGLMLMQNVFAQEVTVAAAANLQAALEELKTTFENDVQIKLKTVIGSSGKLTAQIENGAPFDIFMSADMSYPETLFKEGLAMDRPQRYAYGVLVLWTLKPIVLSMGVELLPDPSIRKIAVADPRTAPYGREAVNVLKYYNLYPRVARKLVYGESIAQTNQFITTQAADIGFTSKSTVAAPGLKEKGTWAEIDPQSYNAIAQGAVILKHAQVSGAEPAQKFYNFLFSAKAKDIFKHYGYKVDE